MKINKLRRMVSLTIAFVLAVGSLSGCNKPKETMEEKNVISEQKFNEILAKLDEVMNLRYTGYDSIDFKEKYGEVFDESTCEELNSTFKNNSEYYDIENLYIKNFNTWKKAVELDGGILNEDLSVTRIENASTEDSTEASTEASAEMDYVDQEDDYISRDVFDGYDGEDEPTVGVSEKEVDIVRETSSYNDVEESPMASDLYNVNGEKVWSAKTQEEIDNMTEDDIRAFNEIMAQNNMDFTSVYRGVVDEQLRIEKEKETYGMDTGDGDPDPDPSQHITTVADVETSEIVQIVDGRHVIAWSDLLKGFNRDTNRIYFTVLGYQEYIDVTEIGEFPAIAAKGNEDYKFDRTQYELLNDNEVNVRYESRYMGGLRYKVDIKGKIVDDKLSLEATEVKKLSDIFR